MLDIWPDIVPDIR